MAASLEAVLCESNIASAWGRVRGNDGCAGADALTLAEFDRIFSTAWPQIARQIRAGTYRPQPLREALIPKAGGATRTLRIPSVSDRLVQQAVAQVLGPVAEPNFSPASFAYRPRRGPADALVWLQRLHRAPDECVMHLDIADFFDAVPHAVALEAARRLVDDVGILTLIDGLLHCGVWRGGLAAPLAAGLPQGSPLSPLLANLVLDPVDHALTAAGHRFVRYADDVIIVLAEARTAPGMQAWIEEQLIPLGLRLNRTKCAATGWDSAEFLGFTFHLTANGPRTCVSPANRTAAQAHLGALADRLANARALAARMAADLHSWFGYFRRSDDLAPLDDLIEQARDHARAAMWRDWPPATRCAELARCGCTPAEIDAILATPCHGLSFAAVLRRAIPSPFPDLLNRNRLLDGKGRPSRYHDYSGRMNSSPDFSAWKATLRLWATRLWNRRAIRVGIDFARSGRAALPRPSAIRLSVFGIQFRVRL